MQLINFVLAAVSVAGLASAAAVPLEARLVGGNTIIGDDNSVSQYTYEYTEDSHNVYIDTHGRRHWIPCCKPKEHHRRLVGGNTIVGDGNEIKQVSKTVEVDSHDSYYGTDGKWYKKPECKTTYHKVVCTKPKKN